MNNPFYFILKRYTTAALPFFFKKWKVSGVENIPPGPVLFVPNHQNAFMDAVLVACSTPKNPWFVTRSDVFKNKKAAWILSKMKMMPVFRLRDGFSTLKNNDELFEKYINKINSGQSLLIFAEGNHGILHQLGPFQKGFAKIALRVNPEINLHVIPVGIQYESRHSFLSNVLVSFGKPVSVNEFRNLHSREAQELLVQETRNRILPLIVHIENENYEERVQHYTKNKVQSDDLLQQLNDDQLLISNFPELNKNPGSTKSKIGFNIPLKKYIQLNMIAASTLTQKLILNRIQDPQFKGSVKFAAGIFLFPPLLMCQAIIIGLIFHSVTAGVIYALSIPLGILALKK